MPMLSRRTFVLSAGATVLAGCAGAKAGPRDPTVLAPQIAGDGPPAPTATPVPPTPTPRPVPSRGTEERTFLAGTPAATRLVIRHSGVRGPAVMVLGGVHGNEPGGWLAAEEVANWEPKAGSLIVVPRANVIAIAGFVRTTDEIGDLNRLYPGNSESPLLMERMTAAILDVAREFEVKLLLDMHESWAFYAEYPPGGGTGALGQTITAGVGPQQADFGQRLQAAVNTKMTTREEMIVRDGTRFSRPSGTVTSGPASPGRSSLSAGGHVAGLTPVLVEMGQEHQELDRRIALHQIVARATLELMGVL